MGLVSSKVATGVDVLADTFNKLRDDLLFNHDHSSGRGATVSHGDLGDGTISGVYHTHANIETHMNGTSGAFGDGPGGSKGVHGLHSTMCVQGCAGRTTQTEGGDANGPDGIQYVEIFGVYTPGEIGKANVNLQISFGSSFAFSTIPYIWVTPNYNAAGYREFMDYQVHTITTTSFYVRIGRAPSNIFWRAMGTKV